MNKIVHFSDLDAWKVNHEVARQVYKLTEGFPRKEQFGMIDQLRRAAVSVTANIAEGWGRYSYPDRIRFYLQARGSIYEIQNFLILAKDLGYVETSLFTETFQKVEEGCKVLNGLIRSLEARLANSK